ncbi:MAG: rhodanese-like domain-containing protein [Halobacteria archaeon]|nr:rhodanese-like domain-containing protein [Halobacteria archaeon]
MTDDSEVSVDEAKEMIEEGATVVDVRTPDEYDRGHIPNSVSAPIDNFAAHLGKLEGREPLVLVCERGEASRQGVSLLQAYGGVDGEQAYNLREGLVEWDGEWEGDSVEEDVSDSATTG